jgi:hypothetical protein
MGVLPLLNLTPSASQRITGEQPWNPI